MKFSEFVLSSRERLQDIRDASGVIITDPSKDGIRWTSAKLVEVCIGSLHEMSRALIGLRLTNHYNNSALTRLPIPCVIKKDTGLITFTAPERMYTVLRIQEVGDRSAIYSPVNSEDFFSNRYRSTYVNEKFFTAYLNETSNKVEHISSKIPTVDTPAEAIIKVQLDDFYTLASTVDMPFMDIEDLMLDYLEKNADIIQHNPTQVQVLREEIKFKIGILTNEGIKTP